MSEFACIGKSIPQIDSVEKVTGRLEFVSDIKKASMLCGKILRSNRPHARIIKIDTGKAEQLPGVKAIVTFKDTPAKYFGPLIADWLILAKDKVRFIGEEVAAVAAVDEEIALEALSLIKVEYEDLPAVFDPEEAMLQGAPLVNGNLRNDNIAYHFHLERGDVDEAFTQADFIFEDTFSSQRIYQGYLEANCCVAEMDGKNNISLWAPAHGIYAQKLLYAKALDIPSSKLRIVKPAVGGSFGAKFENDTHLVAAVLAKKAGYPVRIEHTREEDIIASNSRVPMNMTIKLGLKADGTFLAKQVRVVSNNGARTVYCPPITATACYRVDALYRFQNTRADGFVVYTNTAPSSAMRGFGNAQMTFALESSLDMIAEKMGIDPVELRFKNFVKPGDTTIHGWQIGTCGVEECARKVTQLANFAEKRTNEKAQGVKKRGIGLACANHVSGNRGFFGPFDGSSAFVRILEDGRVKLTHGEADLGQGQNTVFAQMASETLGIGLEKIEVNDPDTDHIPFGLGSWASRGTVMGGNAVIAAAKDARDKLLETAASLLNAPKESLTIKDGSIFVVGEEGKCIDVGEAVQEYVYKHTGLPLVGQGSFKPDTQLPDPKTKYGNISPAYPYAAHVAEVEVDTETGSVEIINYWAADDVGRAINKLTLEGQLVGGIAMGIGWALTEKMISDKGRFLNANLLDYKMLGPCDMPKNINLTLVEPIEPNGPFGAKGASELILNPIPATIANAVYDAIGVRIKDLPITPEKILQGLGKI